MEDIHGSSVLQQSMTEMQNLNSQRSFYSDPQQCKIENLKIIPRMIFRFIFSNNDNKQSFGDF